MSLIAGFLVAVLAPQGTPEVPESGPARAHPRRLLLRTDARFERVPAGALFPELGLRELWNLPEIGWRAVEVMPGKREPTRAALALDPLVLEVRHDLRRELAQTPTPDDVLFATQWYLNQIRVPEAWELELGDPSVVVAVIDTGVDLVHPDLAANLWTNPGELAGNALDDDGNGYVDDLRGYDFANSDSDPSDDNGHGTNCAGIVAAAQGNGIGISGVAPGCRIAVVKAALANGHFYASATVPALVYCANMGFDVLSMSFFSDEVVPAERDALDYCVARGVLPVVAAGNHNSVLPTYPAAYRQALSVGATFDTNDGRAFFSNWGTWVGAAAPGWMLTTTEPFGGFTTGFSGTSGAAPQVAGIAALLFSAAPSATAEDVRAAIEDSCVPLEQSPLGRWTSYGRVDADAALARILGTTSGSVPARVAFAAPCGGLAPQPLQAALGHAPRRVALEIVGVGLEQPNSIVVSNGARVLPLLAQARQAVRVSLPLQPNTPVHVRCNDAIVESWVWVGGAGLVYAATDAGTDDTLGSQATGGWRELYRQDADAFLCTRDANAEITCAFAVRKVDVRDIGRLTLEWRRDYEGMLAAPVETLELYDWSSASYPYGSWVTLFVAPAPTSAWSTLTLDVPGDPNRYRDGEGTFYLRLTTTGAGPSGMLRADMLRLRVR